MESKPHGTDWRSILLVIFGFGGAVLAISSAIGILIFIAVNENFLTQMNTPVLASVLIASTLIAIGLLLLPVAWLSVRRLRGLDFDSLTLPPLRPWAWIVIVNPMVAGFGFGNALLQRSRRKFVRSLSTFSIYRIARLPCHTRCNQPHLARFQSTRLGRV